MLVIGSTLAGTAGAVPAGSDCPARGSRVVFAASDDALGGNWGIAAVLVDGTGEKWLFGPEKGGAYNFRPSISPADGTIVWDTNQGGRQRIRTMACDGSGPKDWSAPSTGKGAGPKDSMGPAFSPDGTQVAFVARMPGNASRTKPRFGLYVAPFDQPGRARLVTTKVATGGMHPSWSPDGKRLVFAAGTLVPDLFVVGVDGQGLTRLTDTTRGSGEPSWSPDGLQIAYNSGLQGDDVWVMDADGANPRKLGTGRTGTYQPAFSPDGRWIAYVSNPPGHSELWLMRPDGSEAHALTTTADKEANEAPAW